LDNKRVLILISGFGWSGSGALVDYFREHSQINVAGNDEIIFLWALNNLVNKILSGKSINISGEMESLFCARVSPKFSKEKIEQYETTFLAYFDNNESKLNRYQNYSFKILKQLSLLENNKQENLESILNSYLVTLFDLLDDKKHQLIFDNLLHPQNLDLLQYFDLSSFDSINIYCVDRDPRQQFYEQFHRYTSGEGSWHHFAWYQKALTKLSSTKIFRLIWNTYPIKGLAASVFIRLHKKRRDSFQEAMKLLLTINNLKVESILFEEFVLNEGNLKDKLEFNLLNISKLEKNLWNKNKYFNADESAKNINRFSNDKNQTVYKYIISKIGK